MFRKIMPHINLVLAIVLLVFIVINSMNEAMGFLRGTEFQITLLALCTASIVSSIIFIRINEKNRRAELDLNEKNTDIEGKDGV